MKTKIRPVYYCEYCKKHSLMPLLKHEKSCTLNPGRLCRMCEQPGYDYLGIATKIYDDIIKRGNEMDGDPPFSIEVKGIEFLNPVEGCPICALTILRLVLVRLNGGKFYQRIHLETDFDYAKEKTVWWNNKNDDAYCPY